MLTQAPKGTKDLLPQDAYRFQAVEAVEKRIAERAGYREIRTPVFEHTELFHRGRWAKPRTWCRRRCTPSQDKGGSLYHPEAGGHRRRGARAMVEHGLYNDAAAHQGVLF